MQQINLHGSSVVLLSQEHTGDINPLIPPYISSESTGAVVLEYFPPELESNAAQTPLFGESLRNMWESSPFRTRCNNQYALAELCKETGKPVVIIDIANKPAYLVSQFLIPPLIIGLGNTIAKLFPPEVSSAVSSFGFFSLGMLTMNLIHENRDKGLFDKTKIHGYERLLFDAADARRVFVAAGIRHLTNEIKDNNSSKTPNIIVCYPQAHIRRIGNYLQNQSPVDRFTCRLKQLLYRTNFWLDFNIRQYNWDNQSSGWELSSQRGIL